MNVGSERSRFVAHTISLWYCEHGSERNSIPGFHRDLEVKLLASSPKVRKLRILFWAGKRRNSLTCVDWALEARDFASSLTIRKLNNLLLLWAIRKWKIRFPILIGLWKRNITLPSSQNVKACVLLWAWKRNKSIPAFHRASKVRLVIVCNA